MASKGKPGEILARTEAPREIEMKLALDPGAIADILDHPIVAGARKAPSQGGVLHATYFDTREQDLRGAGLSLRIRRHGERWIQTLKADGGAHGLVLDRDEWETPLRGEALDWRALEGTALDTLLGVAHLKDRVRPAFSVRTDRRAFLLVRKRARIELVLDQVEVEAGERTARFGEIELEVKRGTGEALFDVALDLAQAAPVRLSLATKSERGYALLDGHGPKAVKAERVRLEAGQSSAEAFQAIARSCLAQAVQNDSLVREHRSAEGVHQFRVGLRRLRAAASLFSDLICDDESRAVREDLRWMNHSLGPIRDLDVLIARLQGTPDHQRSLQAAERQRQEAFDQLLVRLDEPRFRCGTLAAAAWIETGRWLTLEKPDLPGNRNEPIERRAARELAKRRRRVIKRARGLRELDPEARHEVRIEIKKLRYGVEFFAGLFTGKKSKKRRKATLQALAELQEVLGALNDIAVGGHLFAPASTAEMTDAAEATSESVEDLLDRAARVHRQLAATKIFWE
jgi:inorganic triphosphatase YgiF